MKLDQDGIDWLVILAVLFVFMWYSTRLDAAEVAQYNDYVLIYLSDQPCKMMDEHYLAVAKRIDGQYLQGCFVYEDDKVKIQWSANPEDVTVMERSRFVQEPE